MLVRKIRCYKLVCMHCGAEISISNDEYTKYREATEDYSCSVITCQRKDEEGKNHDIQYTNFDCPVCSGYIPVTVADGCDADEWGFVYSKNVIPIYDNYESVKIEDYIDKTLGFDNESEVEEG